VARGQYDHRNEIHGATYTITPMDSYRHAGDPMVLEPPGYQHPQRLGRDVLDPVGPRILPVSQAVPHGVEPSREDEFERAIREGAFYLAQYHARVGWRDRRMYGRRYRPTDNLADLTDTPQRPYDTKRFQADVNRPERFLTI
jgi:hypothetical protein